jgi:hypothetical protein
MEADVKTKCQSSFSIHAHFKAFGKIDMLCLRHDLDRTAIHIFPYNTSEKCSRSLSELFPLFPQVLACILGVRVWLHGLLIGRLRWITCLLRRGMDYANEVAG